MLMSLLDIFNIFLFCSGFLMLYTTYRNSKVLRGYKLLGTMLKVLATAVTIHQGSMVEIHTESWVD